MNKKIIGINGKIGSGKSTISDMFSYLFKINNIDSKEFFFAYKLKKMVADLCDVDFELTMTQEGKNTYIEMYDMTLGELLQQIGTNLRDTVNINIWTINLFNQIKHTSAKYCIISDVRFPNELDLIKSNNGISIRITRPDNLTNNKSKRDKNHASEISLDNHTFDYEIINDGTINELYLKVQELFEKITGIKNNYLNDF